MEFTSERAKNRYQKCLDQAHEKYSPMNNIDLTNHKRRLQQELRFFGESFKVLAGIQIIEQLLEEREINEHSS